MAEQVKPKDVAARGAIPVKPSILKNEKNTIHSINSNGNDCPFAGASAIIEDIRQQKIFSNIGWPAIFLAGRYRLVIVYKMQ